MENRSFPDCFPQLHMSMQLQSNHPHLVKDAGHPVMFSLHLSSTRSCMRVECMMIMMNLTLCTSSTRTADGRADGRTDPTTMAAARFLRHHRCRRRRGRRPNSRLPCLPTRNAYSPLCCLSLSLSLLLPRPAAPARPPPDHCRHRRHGRLLLCLRPVKVNKGTATFVH